MYSYLGKDDTGNNKAKGINKNVTEDITQKEYKNMLFEKKQMRHKKKKIIIIINKSHQLGTFKNNKVSLSCFDDTRYALDNEINTLAY